MHLQQISIPGDNHIRSAIERDFQELIVFRIAALADTLDDWYEFGDSCDQSDELHTLFDSHVTIELCLREYVGKFTHRILRDKKNRVVPRFGRSLSWDRGLPQEAADEDVCVNDEPLSVTH
jgi:hypothetical protein